MDATFYDDINEFYSFTYPYLIKKECENNLILAILNNLKDNIHSYRKESPLLFLITEKGTIKLVAIRTPPNDLLISFTDNLNTIEILVDELIQKGEMMLGVLSFKDAADKFSELWCKRNPLELKLLRNERVYKLEKVAEETIGKKKFIKATEIYEESVLKWAREMMLEALTEVNEKEIIETLNVFQNQFKEGKSNFFLLLDKNNPVSMVRKAGKTPNGNFINFVYTPPPLRRRGYATECVAKISKKLLEEGNKYCFLFTDLSNPTSNSIYLKVGYRSVIDMNHYKFK